MYLINISLNKISILVMKIKQARETWNNSKINSMVYEYSFIISYFTESQIATFISDRCIFKIQMNFSLQLVFFAFAKCVNTVMVAVRYSEKIIYFSWSFSTSNSSKNTFFNINHRLVEEILYLLNSFVTVQKYHYVKACTKIHAQWNMIDNYAITVFQY